MALCVAGLVATAGLHHSAQADEPAAVPELPGVEERLDGLYDADGCLRTGESERDCSVTADEIDDTLAGDSEVDVRHLAGFTGSLWTGDAAAGQPVVLEDTVAVSVGAEVEVRGLVRNETDTTVGAVEVTATLRDDRGEEVTVLTGPALVGTVRSGEPVPFVLSAPAPPAAVDRIDWATTIVDAPAVSRDLEWQPYWEQPAGMRDPLENHLYTEVGSGPHPDVTFGSVRNLGATAARDVTVVVAWLDDVGKLAALGQSAALDPAGHAVSALDAGSSADALVVSPDVPPGAEALTWVSGS